MTTAPTPRRRTWIWYFVVLIVLTGLAIALPFILRAPGLEPLTPAMLQTAQERWAKHGPADYDLEYQKLGSVNNKFAVQVRHKRAVAVMMDDQALEPRQYHYHTMDALMDDLQRFLELTAKPGSPPAVLRAQFDSDDGHLIRYLYKVPGQGQHIEVRVKLQAVQGQGSPSKHQR